MKKANPKILIAFNQPVGGIYESYDGRIHKTKVEKSIDLSEVGVLEELEEIRESLSNLGFDTTNINVLNDIEYLINVIKNVNPDVIFNLVESVEGESLKEMFIAGIFELMNVPYTGCDAYSLGLCLNKYKSKMFLKAAGVNIPNWRLYQNPSLVIFGNHLNFPVIVKPSHEDASVGISEESVVYDEHHLKTRIEYMYENFKQPILVEEYIDGREINSAVLGDQDKVALPLSEIDFSTLPKDLPKIVTYDGKWIKDSFYYKATIPCCPAPIEDDLSNQIKQLSLSIAELFGCRDYCRIDLRLDKNNIPYVLEVNPNPDISKDAGFPRAAKAYGLSYEELLITIINFARARG
jgi:D-alanine-D-alanine ligase